MGPAPGGVTLPVAVVAFLLFIPPKLKVVPEGNADDDVSPSLNRLISPIYLIHYVREDFTFSLFNFFKVQCQIKIS